MGGILKILKILPILIQTKGGGRHIYNRDKGEGFGWQGGKNVEAAFHTFHFSY